MPHSPSEPTPLAAISYPGIHQAKIQGKPVRLGYLKLTEESKQYRYSFDASYPFLAPEETVPAAEANLNLAAFVTRELQRFRAGAIGASPYKEETERQTPGSVINWDSLSISHNIGVFNTDLLTVDFQLGSYGAGAAHPNTKTQTLNYIFNPSVQLEFSDLFRHDSGYVSAISKYCISALHLQQTDTLKATYTGESNQWILRGAGPEKRNFEKFLLESDGMRIFFDPYSVACYAEGRYEVLVPLSVLSTLMKESVLRLLR